VLASAFALAEDTLQRIFSTFPDGLPGVGLIFLRFLLGISTIFQAIGMLGSTNAPLQLAVDTLSMLLAIAVLIGFLTPISCGLITIVYLTIGSGSLLVSNGQSSSFTALDFAVISAALVLLGPGAFSLDAKMFGRREIRIPRKGP
jgi:uncharacterized membrane protein YphA (DoxX/SURF4 family)